MTKRFEGVLVPVVTPFDADLMPDAERFLAICRALLVEGADGLAIFGTTSEANSIGASERMALLEMLAANGIPPQKLMPGVGATSLDDVARLADHAGTVGCGGVLLLPPFYYKGVSDDGLFDFVAQAIAWTRNLPDVYLYHIPPVARVGYSLDLIERLLEAFPGTVVGIKDSSGDFANTKAMIDRFPGFQVFAGSEVFLLDTLCAGGAGCITATGSVNLAGIRDVYLAFKDGNPDDLQQRASKVRGIIQDYPVVPALKAMLADATGDPAWARVRPPLRALADAQWRELASSLEAADFTVSPRVAAMDGQPAGPG